MNSFNNSLLLYDKYSTSSKVYIWLFIAEFLSNFSLSKFIKKYILVLSLVITSEIYSNLETLALKSVYDVALSISYAS